jgi:hypothetical protein
MIVDREGLWCHDPIGPPTCREKEDAMKRVIAIVLLVLGFAGTAFAQSGLAEIEKEVREQEARLYTVELQLLHMDITHATDRAIRAFAAFGGLQKKIQKLSTDPALLCVQLPALRYQQTLREVKTSAAQVVELMHKVTPLVKAGGVPSEGMAKFMAGDLPSLMQEIASDGTKLQALFSDLETSCSKDG